VAEELQSLLDRIQKDGVDKAEVEAGRIISEARANAEDITAQAKKSAEDVLTEARTQAASLIEHGKKTLEQAARDVVLSISQALNATLEKLVSKQITRVMDEDTLKEMLVKIVELYCRKEAEASRIDILLNPDQQKAIADFFLLKFAKEAEAGIEVRGDSSIIAGFRVSLKKEKIEHDFSEQAITDALCQILRPQLAEITRTAMGSREDKQAK
jgi:V/A-type H+-transporting ATPase subunit E